MLPNCWKGLPLGVILGKIYGLLFLKMQQEIQDALANANSLATEIISSIRTVRSFANENGESINYYNKMKIAYLLQSEYELQYRVEIRSNFLSRLDTML